MVEQLDMDSFIAQCAEEDCNRMIEEEKQRQAELNAVEIMEDDDSGLSDRQIALRDFQDEWQETHRARATDLQILENMDDEWYGFYKEIERKGLTYREAKMKFNNLTCRKELTNDKEALRFVVGSRVYIGNGFAKTSWEEDRQIIKYRIDMKRSAKKMTIAQINKSRNNQLAFDFQDSNKIKRYESKLSKLDNEIEELQNQMKHGDKRMKELPF